MEKLYKIMKENWIGGVIALVLADIFQQLILVLDIDLKFLLFGILIYLGGAFIQSKLRGR
jgi:phage shock protein PspC (stress-responsive transcriptional regulator)